jgi:outer membrane autotransporter protein
VLPEISERLAGRQTGSMTTVALELGYAFDLRGTEVTPFIGVAHSRMRLRGFDEYRPDGAASLLALGFASQTVTSTPLSLGVEIRHDGQTRAGNKVSGWMRAVWEHDLSNDRGLTAGFLSASGASFGIIGTTPERNAFKVSAGLEMELDTNVTAHIALNGRFSGNERDYGAEIGINFKW